MRFQSIHVLGFGKLANNFRFSDQKLTLVMERNEAGKSTLANALLFGIYGLPDGRSNREILSRVQLAKPWFNTNFEVVLQVVSGKKSLQIKRNFATRELKVTNLENGFDVTAEYSPGRKEDVGNLLFRMSLMDAFKTLFIQQTQIVLESGGLNSLEQLIHKIVDSNAGDSNVTQALNALQKSLSSYPFPIISKSASLSYELQKLDEEIQRCKNEIQRLESLQAAYRGHIQRSEEVVKELDALQIAEKTIQLRSLFREKTELTSRIENYEKNASIVSQLDSRIRELEYYSKTDLSLEEPARRTHTLLLNQRREFERSEIQVDLYREQLVAKERQIEQHPFGTSTQHHRDRLNSMKYTGESAFINAKQAETSFRDAHTALQQKGVNEPVRFIEEEEKWANLSPEDELIIAQLEKGQIGTAYAIRKRDAQEELKSLEDQLIDLDVLYRKKTNDMKTLRWISLLVLALGIGGLLSGVPILLGVGIGVGVLGILLFVVSWIRLSRLPTEVSHQKLPLEGMIPKAKHEFDQAEEEYLAVHQKLQDLLNTLQKSGYRELHSEWRLRRELRREIEDWKRWYEDYHRNAKILNDIQSESSQIISDAGIPTSPENITLVLITDSIEKITQALQLQRESEEYKRRIEEITHNRESIQRELQRLEAELWKLLEQASVPNGLPEVDAVNWFFNTIQKRRDYDQCDQEKKIIVERLPSIEQYQTWKQRYDQVMNAVRDVVELEVPVPYNAMSDGDALVALSNQRKQLLEENKDLEIRLDEFQREWQQHSTIVNRLEDVETAKREATRFRYAVEHAMEEIDVISKDLHKNWSIGLNNGTSIRLEKFGEPRQVTFSEQLEMTVTLPERKVLRDHELVSFSAGARDQLYLAVRLALVEFLSANDDPLPVILDEPFAQCDDERFNKGMHLLLEESKSRQVLLFTCHEQRHQKWLQDNPSALSLIEQVNLR